MPRKSPPKKCLNDNAKHLKISFEETPLIALKLSNICLCRTGGLQKLYCKPMLRNELLEDRATRVKLSHFKPSPNPSSAA
jgi:hypothetical protein